MNPPADTVEPRWGTHGSRSWAGRLLAVVVSLACAAVAGAQCSVGPEYAEVTLPDFLAVYYQNFRSDPQEDRVEFYGGVCVTAVGGAWTVTSQKVTVTGLTGELALHSDNPTLYLGQWQIAAAELDSTVEELRLVDAQVTGPDVSGNAERLTVDLITSEINMSGLHLSSLAFAVSGQDAVLRGEMLTLHDAGVTTCIGLETAPYEIEGLRAEVDLGARSVVLSGGMLRLGAARFRLREEIVLSEQSLAEFSLPVEVQNVSGSPSRPGTGLGVRFKGVPLEDDVVLDVGATGIDTDHPTGAVALLRLGVTLEDSTQVEADVGLEAGRPYVEIDLTRPLAPWLDLELGALSGALPGKDARHEASVGLDASVPVSALRGSVGAEVFTAMTVLAPAMDPTATTIAGTRLGGAVNLSARTQRTAAGTVSLAASAGVTTYPNQDAMQWAVSLRPSWAYDVAPLTARFSYDARFTNSGSPFGVSVDQVTPISRATGTVRLAGELERWEPFADWNADRPPELFGTLEFSGIRDQVALTDGTVGWQQARARAALSLGMGKWDIGGSVIAETAGLLNPVADLDAYMRYRLAATLTDWPVVMAGESGDVLPHGDFEVGIESEFGLVDELGMRRLELFTGVPLAFRTFELRPYVAFDFAPTVLDGLAPLWSSHGVDLTLITCCGSVTVGYLNDRGNWSASLSVDLERRPVLEEP